MVATQLILIKKGLKYIIKNVSFATSTAESLNQPVKVDPHVLLFCWQVEQDDSGLH